MGVAIAILGLALLVMIHEAGHFFAARAVGMTPRKFYLGFGPAIVKTTRGDVEYGIGALPLGGYVKIPGMNKPAAGALAASLRPEPRAAHAEQLARVDRAIALGDDRDALAELEPLRPALGATRVFQELEWSLAPDAYWKQKTWKRLTAIAAGPAVNLVFAILLFTGVYMVVGQNPTSTIGTVVSGSPAQAAGLRAGDRILSVDRKRATATQIAPDIRATKGKPFRFVVVRGGSRTVVGPVRAKLDSGSYRVGIALDAGPGESIGGAARDSLRVTWDETRDTVVGLAHLARGRDTNHVSSSVGIVKASAAAWRQGLSDFLFTLGLISLALGLLNLLPVLPLDGGHIVMALVEKVRGAAFGQTTYIRYSIVGLTLFGILMYFGLSNDLHLH